MAITGVNTAMNPLQFATARAQLRTVETTDHTSTRSPRGMSGMAIPPAAVILGRPAPKPPRLIAAATFHCTYRPITGKLAAKRLPQVADNAYWSLSLNRLG